MKEHSSRVTLSWILVDQGYRIGTFIKIEWIKDQEDECMITDDDDNDDGNDDDDCKNKYACED